MTRTIIDTGPIVALLNARDTHHTWAREMFATLEPPLLTCEAVIAETCHRVRKLHGGPSAVLAMVTNGVLEIPFALAEEAAHVRSLMERYASVPMSLADASLVRMAELDGDAAIATIDSDFRIYRRNRRQALRLLHPG